MPETSVFRELLVREFAPYGSLSSSQLDQLEAHYRLLERWNARMNLTRIRRVEDVVRLHYCESLFLGTLLPAGELNIADVGSGGGFPGIPLAILRKESRVALVESHQRKAVFLREASGSLPNLRVISSRAEDVKERFDWIVSRAVSPAEVVALKLSPNVALLIGEGDASQLNDWKLKAVPWGQGRVVALRSRVRSEVPRGTLE
jgi:16S rRNA (guanine(527)-N(7))-methyltransferase RsmG